jgi:hypothetical protein
MKKDGLKRSLTWGAVSIVSFTLLGALFGREKVVYRKPKGLTFVPDLQYSNENVTAGISLKFTFH